MPYKYQYTRMKIPRKLDKRVKILDEDKERIMTLYGKGISLHSIERDFFEYRISRRSIQFILFPERKEKCRIDYKTRRIDGRYYDKDKWRVQMRNHRRYKQSIKDKLI